jgi:hypothetical protein
MLQLVAAAIAASSPQTATAATSPAIQARATVRIVSAARLHWGEERSRRDIPPPRATTIRTLNGPEPAKLIEFE